MIRARALAIACFDVFFLLLLLLLLLLLNDAKNGKNVVVLVGWIAWDPNNKQLSSINEKTLNFFCVENENGVWIEQIFVN